MASKTCIVIPVTWSGTSGDGVSGTLSTLAVQWDAAITQVTAFFDENSYGQFHYTFTRIAPVSISAPSQTSELFTTMKASADAAATSGGHNPASFDYTCYIAPDGCLDFADAAGKTTSTSPPSTVARAGVWSTTNHLWGLVAHEAGHAAGVLLGTDYVGNIASLPALPHSNAYEWSNDASTLGLPFQPRHIGFYSVPEYSNTNDLMGDTTHGGHFSARQKKALGWMAGRILSVSSSGSYTLFPLEASPVQTQALVVQDGSYTDDVGNVWTAEWWIEYRDRSGYDSANAASGVIVYLLMKSSTFAASPYIGLAIRVDMAYSDQPTAADLTPGLPVGSTFTTPNGLSITNSSMGASASVSISGIVVASPTTLYFDDWRVQTSGYPIGYQPSATNFFQALTPAIAPTTIKNRYAIGATSFVGFQAITNTDWTNAASKILTSTGSTAASTASVLHVAIHNFTRAMTTTVSSAASNARVIPLRALTATVAMVPSITAPIKAAQLLSASVASSTRMVRATGKQLSVAAASIARDTISKPVSLIVTLLSSDYPGELGVGELGAFELGSTGQGGILTSIQTAVTLKLRAAVTLTALAPNAASAAKAVTRTITTAIAATAVSTATLLHTSAQTFLQTMTATVSNVPQIPAQKFIGLALTAVSEATSSSFGFAITKTIRMSTSTLPSMGLAYAKTLLYQASATATVNIGAATTLLAATPGYVTSIAKNVTEALSAKVTTRLRGRHKKHTDRGDAETTSDDKGTPH